MRLRIYLTFSAENVREPIIWKLGHEFELVTNIRTAEVRDDMGMVGLELDGEREVLEEAGRWLEEQGVDVQTIGRNGLEG